MKERGKAGGSVQAEPSQKLATVQIPIRMLDELEYVHQGFWDLCIEAGHQVLLTMMEGDREQLCGPRWSRSAGRSAVRAGSAISPVTLGGRRVGLKRLRARDDEGEVILPSFAFAADRDPLDARTLEAMTIGVSTRKYARSLDPLPESRRGRSTSKSSVSRRFVALTQKKLCGCTSP